MSFTENQLLAKIIIEEYSKLGNKKVWRHVVAVFFKKGDNFEALIVSNEKSAPEVQTKMFKDKQIYKISILELPFIEIDHYNGIIALPEICCLRPEISSLSPNFFSLSEYIPANHRKYLFDTRTRLMKRLPQIFKYNYIMDEHDFKAEYALCMKSLILKNFLSEKSMNGLIALTPGNDINTCISKATLFFLPETSLLPKGDFTAKKITTIQILAEDLPERKILFVHRELLPFVDFSGQIFDLEALLYDAGNHNSWELHTYSELLSWKEELSHEIKAHSFGTTITYTQIKNYLSMMRNPDLNILKRMNAIEKAYLIAGQVSPEFWFQAGYEKVLYLIFEELKFFYKTIQTDNHPNQPYFKMLGSLYDIDTDYNKSEKMMFDEIIQHIRPILAIDSLKKSAYEYERCLYIDELHDYLLALSRHAVSEKMKDTIKKKLAPDFLIFPTNKMIFSQKALGAGFLECNFWQHILSLVHIYHLSESIKKSAEIEQKKMRLQQLSKQTKTFIKWHLVLPHEKNLIGTLTSVMSSNIQLQAEQFIEQPVIICEILSSEVLTDQSNDGKVIITLENTSHLPAKDLRVKLLPSDIFELKGEKYIQSWDILKQGDSIQTSFFLEFKATGDISFDIEIFWKDQISAPNIKTFSITVKSPYDKPPSNIDTSPAGQHIIEPKHFHGRHNQLVEIIGGLVGNQHYLIQGPRRSGKSSLAEQIKNCIEDSKNARKLFNIPEFFNAQLDQYLPVWMTLQSLHSQSNMEHEFYTGLINVLRDQLLSKHNIKEIFQKDENYSRSINDYFHNELKALTENLPTPYHKISFIIDEFNVFDQLDKKTRDNIYSHLRAIIDNTQNVQWNIIIAMGQSSYLSYTSPLFNLFSFVELNNLSHRDFHSYILSQMKNIHFFPEAINEIYTESGGNPYVTNLLLHELIILLREKQTSTVKRPIIIDTVGNFLRKNHDSHFSFVWKERDRLSRIILYNLCNKGDSVFTEAKIKQLLKENHQIEDNALLKVKDCLKVLKDQGILIKQQNRWTFAIPIVKKWLQYRYLSQDDSLLFSEGVENG